VYGFERALVIQWKVEVVEGTQQMMETLDFEIEMAGDWQSILLTVTKIALGTARTKRDQVMDNFGYWIVD